MPSTTLSSSSRPEPSSTVITPSLPTLSIASAMRSPMAASLLADTEPTCRMALRSLRPLGPSVTFTALARTLTPATMRERASSPNLTSLAAMINSSLLNSWDLLGEDAHDVVFTHDDIFGAIDLHFGAGVLAEEDGVTG